MTINTYILTDPHGNQRGQVEAGNIITAIHHFARSTPLHDFGNRTGYIHKQGGGLSCQITNAGRPCRFADSPASLL